MEEIEVSSEESTNYYHRKDNKVLPADVDQDRANREGGLPLATQPCCSAMRSTVARVAGGGDCQAVTDRAARLPGYQAVPPVLRMLWHAVDDAWAGTGGSGSRWRV